MVTKKQEKLINYIEKAVKLTYIPEWNDQFPEHTKEHESLAFRAKDNSVLIVAVTDLGNKLIVDTVDVLHVELSEDLQLSKIRMIENLNQYHLVQQLDRIMNGK